MQNAKANVSFLHFAFCILNSMRRLLISGNWKMYKTIAEAVQHVKALRPLVKDITDIEIAVAPAFPAIHAVADALRGSNIAVAAQDVHWEREGAFTGEVSAPMLREAGAELVIIGHSERRTHFGETDATVNRKIGAALAAGLTPIVCIGETVDQRERNETLDVLDRQIKSGLDGVTSEQLSHLVLAYEPVWAIGTGRNATPAQAGEAHHHIRQRLRQWFGADAAELCRIIYGGSAKPENIRDLVAHPDVDGGLVGGASLDVRAFLDIISRSRTAPV